MGKVILKTDIARKEGMLYYCATDSKGNLTVCETRMARGGRRRKKATARKTTKRRATTRRRR